MMKKALSALLTASVLLTAAGCTGGQGNKESGNQSAKESSSQTAKESSSQGGAQEVVTLKWAMVGNGMPKNYDAWKKNIDKYLGEKIGVNIEVEVVPWGDWGSRRSVIVNTAGDFDILFTDMGSYAGDVRLNAFADISSLVETASPNLYKYIPKDYWEACKINGKLYAVPTYKDSSATMYFVWDKEMLTKYNIKAEDMHSLDALTESLKKIKDGEGTAAFPLENGGLGQLTAWYDGLGMGVNGLGVRFDDKNRKVVAVFEQEDVMKDLKLMHQWYQDGIINKDAATLSEGPKYKPCFVAQGWSGAAVTTWGPNMGKEVVAYQWGDTVASNGTIQGSLNCISSSCKNPDKALAFLELVNTDTYVRDAFYYGLEGDNFKYTDDKRVHKNNTDWSMAGYTQGTFFTVSQLDDVDFNQWDEVKKLNETAKPSVLLGFTFDTTNYANQIANCSAIFERYKGELLTGTAEPEKTVADMMTEMRAAGFDELVKAAQEAIDKQYSK